MATQEISLRFDNFYAVDRYLPNCLPRELLAWCIMQGDDQLDLSQSWDSPVQNCNFELMLGFAYDGKVTINHTEDPIKPNSRCFYVIEPLGDPKKYIQTQPFTELISPEALKKLQDKTFHLIINYSMEGYSDQVHMFYEFLDILNEAKIYYNNVSFLTGDNGPYTHDFEVKTNWFEEMYRWQYENSNRDQFSQKFNAENHRPKHYLCMNRVPRGHRLSLVAYLANNELLKYGYVSFPANEDDLKWIWRPRDFEHLLEKIRNLVPLVIDEEDFTQNFAVGFEKAWPYEKSYFSIVTETNFYDSGVVFFSEKIWKPILNYHPFILVGSPRSLETLQTFGYETFSDFWDEGYDQILDSKQRLEHIMININLLCGKSISEMHQMYIDMQPILEHNRKNFLERESNKEWLEHVLKRVERRGN